MKKVLIDTNIYSAAMRAEEFAVDILKRNIKILLSPVVIGELLSGFKRGLNEEKNREQLHEFMNRERVFELSISSDTSEFYASNLQQLKEQGTPIPTNDIWIAASAMENGAPIVTRVGHFSKIKGIIVLS